MPLRTNTYSGEPPIGIDQNAVQRIIRESAGQQMPPGAVPEDRVAPSTQDGDVTSTVNGKTVWTPSEDLPGVIAANDAASAAQAAADDAAADALAAQIAADAAAAAADAAGLGLAAHLSDTINAHMASAIGIIDSGGNFTSSEVEGALDEAADAILAHVNDTTDAHDATAISFVNLTDGIVGSDISTALRYVNTYQGGRITGHMVATSDAHPSTAITVTESGIIIPATTDVQQALRNVEAYVQNLEEKFEQHHHDERYILGKQVPGGWATAVNDTSGAGDKLSFTVEGDGITPMKIEAQVLAYQAGGAAGSYVRARIRDGAGGTGTIYQTDHRNLPAGYAELFTPIAVVAPFTGSRTFYLYCDAAAGTLNTYETTGGTRRWMRATWAPGYPTS